MFDNRFTDSMSEILSSSSRLLLSSSYVATAVEWARKHRTPLALASVAVAMVFTYRALTRKTPRKDSYESHVLPHGPLQRITENFYVVEGSFRQWGSDAVPRTMTIYVMPSRQSGGRPSLLVHSCVAVNAETKSAIEALGNMEWLIVPSPAHRMDCAVYKREYNNVKVICPRASEKYVSRVVKVDALCEDVLPSLGITIHAPPALRLPELFYEIQSQQLGSRRTVQIWLVCDVIQNVPNRLTMVHRFVARWRGPTEVPCVDPFYSFVFVKDKQALGAWLRDHMASAIQDEAYLIPAHGTVVQKMLKDKVLKAAAAV